MLFSLSLAAALAPAARAQPAPIAQKSGAWWGDVATPTVNQLWADAEGVRPDAIVNGTLQFPVTCRTPAPTTLRLTAMVLQVDGTNVEAHYNRYVTPGVQRTLTIDTRKFSDGWHEIRVRCYAQETVGAEAGRQTQVTNGHAAKFVNGNSQTDPHSVGINFGDSHPWYSNDVATGDFIGYVYTQLLDVHALTDAPLHGVVPVSGRISNAGATTIAHWAVKVDGVVVSEFHGPTELRTIDLDTRGLSNGPHTLHFHGHGLARSGKQLAGEVQVPITVAN